MKRLLALFLGLFMPCVSQAFVSQIYTTNGQAAVDAHVITLISGPTNGASLATVTNVILGMAPTLTVSNSVYSSNFVGRIITNQFNQGIDITNPASRSFYRFNTNGTFAVTQPDGSSGHLAWDGISGTTLYLAGTNGANAAAFMTFQSITETLPRMTTVPAVYTDAMILQKQGLDPVIMFTDGGADNVLSLGDSSLCSQEIELWVKNTISFGSQVNGSFPNNLDLQIDITNERIKDGNLVPIIGIDNHDYYGTNGTAMVGGTSGIFTGNGINITNLISTNEVVTTTTFASATNKLVLNNGRWLLQSATPGSLTNIIVAAPYTWATLVVSNSSATTNSFLISAAARYFGLVSTNLIQVYPGKMAYISIDAMANVWTNICTVTQQ